MVVVRARSISLFDQSTPLRAMFWLRSVGGWWGLIWLRAAPLGVSGQPASGSQTDWLVPVTPPQSGYWLLTTGVILSALHIGRCEVDIRQYSILRSGVWCRHSIVLLVWYNNLSVRTNVAGIYTIQCMTMVLVKSRYQLYYYIVQKSPIVCRKPTNLYCGQPVTLRLIWTCMSYLLCIWII